jgi:hypothetical protein
MTAILTKSKKSPATLAWEAAHPDWELSWIDRLRKWHARYEEVCRVCFPRTGGPVNLLDFYDAVADEIHIAVQEECPWQYRPVVAKLKTAAAWLCEHADDEDALAELVPGNVICDAVDGIPDAIYQAEKPLPPVQSVNQINKPCPGGSYEWLAKVVGFTGPNAWNMVAEEIEKDGTHCTPQWRAKREKEVEAAARKGTEEKYPGTHELVKFSARLMSLGIGTLARRKGEARPSREG